MLLEKANINGYQIGKTKLFLRAGQMAELDACRAEILGKFATKIRAKYLSHSANKKYLLLRASSIPLQTIVRGQVARSRFQNRRREVACVTIQKCTRMFLAMKRYRALRGMDTSSMYLHKTQKVAKKKSTPQEQIIDLTNQLEQEKQARADMAEEIAKLRSFVREITEYSVKEEGVANVEIGQLPQPEDIPTTGNETIDKLTAENIKLKYVVNALQWKVDEAQKLCEERSKQASDAESMVIELKLSMQSLQEKLCDIETEEQIMRQQVMTHPSNTADQQNGQHEKRFDSNLANDTQNENVEALLAAVRHKLGFSKGKPIATYIIYKSLLHWKYFEAERTSIFDRLMQVISSAVEKEHDNKHMAYWLCTTSALLFLIQKSLSPAVQNLPRPSLFGRMTQGFTKSSDLVCHVEAKYPALLFKQQLSAYVEKIFAIIRNNMKNNLSSLISYCFQAARTSQDNPPPPTHWGIVIECLNGTLTILKDNHVPPLLVQKIIIEAFSNINAEIFNRVGEYVKAGLAELEQWCGRTKNEYVGSSLDELQHVRQAVGFLVIKEKSKIGYDELTTKLCPVLGVHQHHRLCNLYSSDQETGTVTPEVLSKLKVFADNEKSSYLLDGHCSVRFSTDEISLCFNEKDFADVKPSGQLLENPAFRFLLE
ncbi:hypothetical protein M8C21_005191 [Ambrosia artemisiifolia]|uniref:Dilute domain-containing protein n=1 Tax=Ambrosia artemisiifolia TaxID=4212 RepID=A0AAD5C685_AMBAR|nr:hypothetical protein M8C21_005191 [Ambrosia artemisiifolia]